MVVVVVVTIPFYLVPVARTIYLLCLLLPFGVNDTEVRIYLPILLLRNFIKRALE